MNIKLLYVLIIKVKLTIKMLDEIVKKGYKEVKYLRYADPETVGLFLRKRVKDQDIKRGNYYKFEELLLITGYKPEYITSTVRTNFYKILAENDFYYETKQRKWVIE